MSEMKNQVARAFLSRLLNDAEREDLRKHEREMIASGQWIEGRYLVGFEIVRRYNLKCEPLPESQMMAMDKLYYKYTDEMEKKHNASHINLETMMPLDCECPTYLDALYAWEDYAASKMANEYNWKMALTVVLLTLTLH